jgi:hypothetical protein
VLWAKDKKHYLDPNAPTKLDLQVVEFNKRFKFTKYSLTTILVLLVTLILLDILLKAPASLDLPIKLSFLALILLLSVILYLWRYFIARMALELSEQ